MLVGLAGCGGEDGGDPLFTLVAPEASGVTFANRLVETDSANVLAYEYFYNGGGVAIGDVDGDARPDLFFTANQGPDALYLNRTEPGGTLQFEDATEAAGVAGAGGWTTGATFADVDGDGDLDLYVARSGKGDLDARRNLLYVNDGTGTFTEEAEAFGLADPSHSTHASFFDADRDGDLDLYLVNHNVERLKGFDVATIRAERDAYAGDKLYRNDPGSGPGQARRFVDVSEAAGIKGNPIGFGLSATVGDVTGDGWPDIYVANDYDEDDYLYVGDGDGTFTDRAAEWLAHTSYFSMGADIADVNNDALPDVVTLDMLPPDNERQKLLKGPENYDRTQLLLSYGYRPQHMRNMLQLNTGAGSFSEIGQVAGISNTDWSWSALLADFDLDGYKDLVVTNGYVRDYTNMDFLKYTAPEAMRAARARGEEPDLLALVEQMPSSDLSNRAFRNRGDLRFEDVTSPWGLERPSLSNGAAYGDLDGDGDLDLVVSNINEPPYLYQNHAAERGGRSLTVRLDGAGGNRFGVGARVEVRADGATLVQEQQPARGYQSSVDPSLVFGLATSGAVDVEVTWPDGRRQFVEAWPVARSRCARPMRPTPTPARRPPTSGSRFWRTPSGWRSRTPRTPSWTLSASRSSPTSCPASGRRSRPATSTATGWRTCSWGVRATSRRRSSSSSPTARSPRATPARLQQTPRTRTWTPCSSTPTATETSTSTSSPATPRHPRATRSTRTASTATTASACSSGRRARSPRSGRAAGRSPRATPTAMATSTCSWAAA